MNIPTVSVSLTSDLLHEIGQSDREGSSLKLSFEIAPRASFFIYSVNCFSTALKLCVTVEEVVEVHQIRIFWMFFASFYNKKKKKKVLPRISGIFGNVAISNFCQKKMFTFLET